MEVVVKVGDGGYQSDSRYLKWWRDGQIIDIREDGFGWGSLDRKHQCILSLPGDFWEIRGSKDWHSPAQSIYDNIQKYLQPVDSEGKYPWERDGIRLDEKRIRRRDWFIDFQALRKDHLITANQLKAIYDRELDPGYIFIDRAYNEIIRHESMRPDSIPVKNMAVSTGTFSIGAALDYATLALFEADIIEPGTGPLTGNLTGEHNAEETATAADITFDVDTATYLLKITAQSGDEHNGGAYGNGARIILANNGDINFVESVAGTFDDLEISSLAFSGGNNSTVLGLSNGADDGMWLVNRVLISGEGDTHYGTGCGGTVTNCRISNCIIYGTDMRAMGGKCDGGFGCTHSFLNNTLIDNTGTGIGQDEADLLGTLTVKNNLCQNNSTDFIDAGLGHGTTGTNVSEDATSPDVAYRSKDVHTNSVFKDYANDDFRLDPEGDATNLAILDDGEDLSGTFTDDIQGQIRSTWYIGASEIVAEGETIQASAADGLSLGDSTSRIATFQAACADGLKTGDSGANIAQLLASLADGMKLGDQGSARADLLASAADGMKFGDAVQAIIAVLAGAMDGVKFGDSSDRRADLKSTASDGAKLSDSSGGRADLLASAVDGMKFGDVVQGIIAILASAADGITLSDSSSRRADLRSTASDGITLSDAVSALLTALATAGDGIRLSDAADWKAIVSAIAADGIKLSEAASRALRLFAECADTVELSDTGAVQATFMVEARDGAQFGDAIAAIMTLGAACSDSVVFSDSAAEVSQVPQGYVSVSFAVKAGTITFLVKKPEISFAGKRPVIRFTGKA